MVKCLLNLNLPTFPYKEEIRKKKGDADETVKNGWK